MRAMHCASSISLVISDNVRATDTIGAGPHVLFSPPGENSNNASRVRFSFNIHNSRHNKMDMHTGYTGCKIEIDCTPMVAQQSVGLDSIPAAGMHTAPAPRLRGRSSIERLPPHP
jgi:hypothetical protein